MKNYVSKLNDRNLQRKRESGLTTYALYSVVVILLYKITELYPLIPLKKHFFEVIEILGPTFNICVGVLIICSVYSSTNNYISSLRIKLSSKNTNLLEETLNSVILLLPFTACLTTSIIQIINNSINNWYYIIFSIIQLLFLVVLISVILSENKKSNNQSIEILDGTGQKSNDKDALSIFTYSFSILIIIYSLHNIFTHSSALGKLNILIFGVFIYAIPCVIITILEIRKKDGFTAALENLEYEINVQNLDNNEIKIRLQQNYLGFLLNDWIIYNLQLIDDFKLDISKIKSEIETMKLELTKVDKNLYAIEYDGRVKNINKKENQIKVQIRTFYIQKTKEIESFLNDSQIDFSERMKLFNLYETLSKELENHEKEIAMKKPDSSNISSS